MSRELEQTSSLPRAMRSRMAWRTPARGGGLFLERLARRLRLLDGPRIRLLSTCRGHALLLDLAPAELTWHRPASLALAPQVIRLHVVRHTNMYAFAFPLMGTGGVPDAVGRGASPGASTFGPFPVRTLAPAPVGHSPAGQRPIGRVGGSAERAFATPPSAGLNARSGGPAYRAFSPQPPFGPFPIRTLAPAPVGHSPAGQPPIGRVGGSARQAFATPPSAGLNARSGGPAYWAFSPQTPATGASLFRPDDRRVSAQSRPSPRPALTLRKSAHAAPAPSSGIKFSSGLPLALSSDLARMEAAGEARPTASLVDALFDRALRQQAMPELEMRMLPAAPSNRAEPAPTPAPLSEPAVPVRRDSLVQADAAASLTRADIERVADRVSRVLEQRARLERERQGNC